MGSLYESPFVSAKREVDSDSTDSVDSTSLGETSSFYESPFSSFDTSSQTLLDSGESLGSLTENSPSLDDAQSGVDPRAISQSTQVEANDVSNQFPDSPVLDIWNPTVWQRIINFFPGNRARAANERAIQNIQEETGQSRGQVLSGTGFSDTIINREGEPAIKAGIEGTKRAIKSLPDVGNSIENTILRTIRGGEIPLIDRTWLDRRITKTDIKPKIGGNPNYQYFDNIGQNIGYSSVTIVSSILSGAATAALTKSPGAAVAAQTTSGGTVAYRSSIDQFYSLLKRKLDEESMDVFGKPMDEDAWNQAKEEYLPYARKYAAGEAVPEAIGNLIFIKAWLKPLGNLKTTQAVESAMSKMINRGMSLASENVTETVTGVVQNQALVGAGLTDEEKSIRDAFNEQFLATLITTGTLGSATMASQYARDFYDQKIAPVVNPDSALGKALFEDVQNTALNIASFDSPQIETANVQNIDVNELDAQNELPSLYESIFTNTADNVDSAEQTVTSSLVDDGQYSSPQQNDDQQSYNDLYDNPFANTTNQDDENVQLDDDYSQGVEDRRQQFEADYESRRSTLREKLAAITDSKDLESLYQDKGFRRELTDTIDNLSKNESVRESEMDNIVQDVLERRKLIESDDTNSSDQTFRLTQEARDRLAILDRESEQTATTQDRPSLLTNLVSALDATEETTADRVAMVQPSPEIDVETTVATPISRTPINFEFDVVEAADLIAASGDLQPRDRTRVGSDSQIRDIAANLDPQELGTSRKTDTGAPIINRDNVVESGNGRVAAIKLHYDEFNDSSNYRAFVESRFPQAAGMQQPILVRRRTTELTPEQVRQFVVESNQDNKLQMSSTETALGDSQQLTAQTMGLWRGGEVTDAANRDFVRSFVQNVIPKQQQNSVMDAQGNLSIDGKRRIEAAMIAKAYGDANLLTKLIESTDNNIRSLGGALLDVAGDWANMRDAIADGRVPARFDITAQLVEAVRTIDQLRQTGQKASEFLAQGTMFDQRDPATTALIKSFFNENMTRALGRQGVYDTLKMYADDAVQQSDESLFGDLDQVQPNELVDRAREQTNAQRRQGEQGGLFDRGPDALSQGDKTQRTQEQSTPLREDRQRPYVGSQQRTSTRQEAVQEERANAETQTNRRVNDDVEALNERPNARGAAGNNRRVDRGGAQTERQRVDPLSQERAQEGSRGTRLDDLFVDKAFFTNRQSVARGAWRAAGYDPNVANNFPIERQFRILADLLKQYFDVRFVEKTLRANSRKAVDELLDLFRNLQFMTGILQLPKSSIGLNGTLGVLSEERRGQYFAAYYPSGLVYRELPRGDKQVREFVGSFIAAVERSNAFAHEWGHALDHFLMDHVITAGRGRGLSGTIRSVGALDVKNNPIAKAYVNLLNAIYFDEYKLVEKMHDLQHKINTSKSEKVRQEAYDQLRQIEQGNLKTLKERSELYKRAGSIGNQDYFRRPTEMIARTFEMYISNILENEGYATEALTARMADYEQTKVAFFEAVYPNLNEKARIFSAWDEVFDAIRAEAILGKDGDQVSAVPDDADIVDPNRFLKNDYLGKRPGLIARELNAWKQWLIDFRNRKNKEKPVLGVKARYENVQKFVLWSERGSLLNLLKRYPHSNTIRRIVSALTTDPGTANLNNRITFEDKVDQQTKIFGNKAKNIFAKYGLVKFSAEENLTFRRLLTSFPDGKETPEMIKAASDLRDLYKELWYYGDNAKLKMGYSQNEYLPRHYDLTKIEKDQLGFFEAASETYQVNFDLKHAKYLDGLQDLIKYLADATNLHNKSEKGRYQGFVLGLQDKTSKDLSAAVKNAKKARRALEALQAEQKSDKPDNDKIDKLLDEYTESLNEALEYAQRTYPDIKRFSGDLSADLWLQEMMIGGNIATPQSASPDADMLKGRKLPPEADVLLLKFLRNDVINLTLDYIPSLVRRAEYNVRFGDTKLETMKRDMFREGVASEDISIIEHMIGRLAGGVYDNSMGVAARVMQKVQAAGIMAMLGRSVLSAVAEPAGAAIQTRNVLDAFKSVAFTMRTFVKTASQRELKELAEAIGVVGDPMMDSIIAHREGADFSNSPWARKVMAKYFVMTLQHQWLTASSMGAMRVSQKFIQNRLKTAMDNTIKPAIKNRAMRDLMELGFQQDEMNQFWEWFSDLDENGNSFANGKRKVNIDDLESDMGNVYRDALYRMTRKIILDPKPTDTAAFSKTTLGRMVMSIQSFAYTFQRQYMIAAAKKIKEEAVNSKDAWETAKVAGGIAGGFATLYAAHTLVALLREMVFNPDKFDDLDDEEKTKFILRLGFSRSGFAGGYDPFVNVAYGLKYEKDVATTLVGATPGYFMQALQRLLQPFIRDSKTNTPEFNAIKGGYELFAIPLLAWAMTTLPGGPVTIPTSAVLYAWLTGTEMKNDVAEFFVGPKGTKDSEKNKTRQKRRYYQ